MMRSKAPQACEVCRIARKRCEYDRNRPAQPCALCAKRGVECSLTASAVQATAGPSFDDWDYSQGGPTTMQ
ncbi:hypothetical protein P692DRAFT_20109691 [Suillus brevipes Sb2]|nr:hypothetical protein P692DRAFT_20109691 [Suillus brevipes Sb2]